jgi:hypothetical protein
MNVKLTLPLNYARVGPRPGEGRRAAPVPFRLLLYAQGRPRIKAGLTTAGAASALVDGGTARRLTAADLGDRSLRGAPLTPAAA